MFDATLQALRGFRQSARWTPFAPACGGLRRRLKFLSKMCLLRNRELAFGWQATARERGHRTAAHGSERLIGCGNISREVLIQCLIGEVEDNAARACAGTR